MPEKAAYRVHNQDETMIAQNNIQLQILNFSWET